MFSGSFSHPRVGGGQTGIGRHWGASEFRWIFNCRVSKIRITHLQSQFGGQTFKNKTYSYTHTHKLPIGMIYSDQYLFPDGLKPPGYPFFLIIFPTFFGFRLNPSLRSRRHFKSVDFGQHDEDVSYTPISGSDGSFAASAGWVWSFEIIAMMSYIYIYTYVWLIFDMRLCNSKNDTLAYNVCCYITLR